MQMGVGDVRSLSRVRIITVELLLTRRQKFHVWQMTVTEFTDSGHITPSMRVFYASCRGFKIYMH